MCVRAHVWVCERACPLRSACARAVTSMVCGQPWKQRPRRRLIRVHPRRCLHACAWVPARIADDAPPRARASSPQRHVTATLEPNESHTATRFDLECTVDPLFHKMSKSFDEGGARGMLLNHLVRDTPTCSPPPPRGVGVVVAAPHP
jgi:hypothetical protein